MSALPGADEPGWYEDGAPQLSVPAWEIPDPDDPVWESPDPGVPGSESPAPGDPVWEAPDPGVSGWEVPAPGDPVWESADLHDPCDDPPPGAPFADGGWADALAPDPVLATLVDLVQREGLGKLDDDQLTGVLQAVNRRAPWCAAQKPPAVSARAARREAAGRASGDWRPFDHADDE